MFSPEASHRDPFTAHLCGRQCLSSFKTRQLLPQAQAIGDRITGITARFVHLAAFDGEPGAATLTRIGRAADLRRTSLLGRRAVDDGDGGGVHPPGPPCRPGRQNHRHCAAGLAVRRPGRVTEFQLTLKSPLLGKASLTDAQLESVAALLHDRMTESVFANVDAALALFTELAAAPGAR